MLFIGLCIAAVVISLIIMAKTKSDLMYRSCGTAIVMVILLVPILLAIILFHKIPYISDRAQAELQAKHDAIIAVVNKDNASLISFSDNISEYNATILKGRRSMDDIWFRDFDYGFYYDLELVEFK